MIAAHQYPECLDIGNGRMLLLNSLSKLLPTLRQDPVRLYASTLPLCTSLSRTTLKACIQATRLTVQRLPRGEILTWNRLQQPRSS